VRNIEDAGIGQRRVKFRLADDRLVAETLFEHFERRTFVQAVRGTEEDAIVRAVGEAQRQLGPDRAAVVLRSCANSIPQTYKADIMPADALADLKKLPGIGDFSAGLTLLRGANAPDAVPSAEPRLARAIALAYGLPGPATPGQILQISENWRPYRTWVTLLLRTQLEYETGEITGRQGHARTG